MGRRRAPFEDSLRPVIVAAAAKILAEQGVAKLSMRSVADAVGISGPSIYHHFPSKQAILTEVVNQGLGIFQKDVASTLAASEKSAPERIRNCVAAHVRYEFNYSDMAKSFDHLLVGARTDHVGDTLRAELVDDKKLHDAFVEWDRFSARLYDVIEEGVSRGFFRVPSVELAASAVISLADGVLLWVRPTPLMTVDRIADLYGDLALRLLGHEGENAGSERQALAKA